MSIVYDPGCRKHLTEREMYTYLHALDDRQIDNQVPEEISDEAAQTIAAWWHSPCSPNSTALSTRGQVTDDMSLADFASPQEYTASDFFHQMALDYLEAYILDRQSAFLIGDGFPYDA